MKGFLAGAVVGIIVGCAVAASAQYVYPGLYTAKVLTGMPPAQSTVYAYGVVDAFIARDFHLNRGGNGAKHLDKAFACLANRVAAGDIAPWLRTVWTADPNRNGALMMVDRACPVGKP